MIKKILVSQPKPLSEKSPYFDIASRQNVEFVFHPFIKVVGISAKEFRQQKVNILDHTAVVFTSRHAIDHFFTLCAELRVNVPETMKYFCITETVSLYIQKYVQYRKRKVFYGNTGKVDGLLPVMVKHKNEKFLVPQSDAHNATLLHLMEDAGLEYTNAIMYRTVSNDFPKEYTFDYDMLIFFSPSGVQALKKNFPEFKQGKTAIGTFGSATAKAVKEAGLRLDLAAPTPEFPSITAALEDYITKINV